MAAESPAPRNAGAGNGGLNAGALAERKAWIERQRIVLAKKRDDMDTADPAAGLDMSKKPEGMTYQFKRRSCIGLEDSQHLAMLREMGWLPVPAQRHPELFGHVTNPDQPAIRGADILMEQPEEFTRDAHLQAFRRARKNIKDQTEKLHISSDQFMPRLPKGTVKGLKSRHDISVDSIPDDE